MTGSPWVPGKTVTAVEHEALRGSGEASSEEGLIFPTAPGGLLRRIERLEARLAILEPCAKSPMRFAAHLWREEGDALVCVQCGVKQEARR